MNRKNFYQVDGADFLGKKVNKLTVIGWTRPENGGRLKLLCQCDCGKKTSLYPYQFTKGKVLSCGCARFGHSEVHKGNSYRKTHGLRKDKFYKKWNDMIRRCYNQNEPAYKNYGALGITVCPEWRETPVEFIAWCHRTHPAGDMLTLDRIDGKKGYSPDNCRWVTQREQTHNLKTNRNITINDKTQCLAEWCRELHISPKTIYKKVKNGMTFEEAIFNTLKNKGQFT